MSEDPQALGRRLKAERERRGMSTQKIANGMHLDEWVIDALEAGDYQRIGPSVYATGHLKKYASLLGVSSAASPPGTAPPLAPVGAAAYPPPIVRLDAPREAHAAWPRIGTVAAAALLAGGVFWWREAHQGSSAPVVPAQPPPQAGASAGPVSGEPDVPADEPGYAADEPAASSPAAPPAALDAAAAAAAMPVAMKPGSAAADPAVATPVAMKPGSAAAGPAVATPVAMKPGSAAAGPAVATPVAMKPGSAAAGPAVAMRVAMQPGSAAAGPAALTRVPNQPSTSESTPGVGKARLRLSFSANSWVDIRDYSGKRLFEGNGRANSVETVAGMAPFRVHLRAVSGVQLQLNGRALAIGGQFISGDEARFEAGADGTLRRDAPAAPGDGPQTAAASPHG